MDAVKFLQEKCRMCRSYILCEQCEIGTEIEKDESKVSCKEYIENFPEKVVKIVEKWSEKNPPKTLLDLFKEQHPNAPLGRNGTPRVCPYILGYTSKKDDKIICTNSHYPDKCLVCWSRPAKEN